MSRTPYLLIIMDGWGIAPDGYPRDKNAIALARTPFFDRLLEEWPNGRMRCQGKAVGLPEGVMGNSEVGHLNLGAGRIVWQDITRIDNEIEKHGLAENDAIAKAMERARDNGSKLHMMGLVSDGAVHSVDRHYFALLRLAKKMGVPTDGVFMHCFMDGRDTPPQSGKDYIEQLQSTMEKEDLGRIATVSGRYYAMDRDKRWDRVKLAWDAVVRGKGVEASDAVKSVTSFYKEDERGDEFIMPRVLEENGQVRATIEDGDEVIFFNFRADRARQLSHALVDKEFNEFETGDRPNINLTTMTRYESGLNAIHAFDPMKLKNILGEIAAADGLKQLRIAETEKYAHVTYFFSGGREEEFDGEDRILVPSPKVATYDKQPEMSAREVTEKLVEAIRSGEYDLIVCNFANCDMVGHTGVIKAAIKAAETVDLGLAKAIPAVLDMGGAAIVTADHGNAEMMWNFDVNCPDTQHSTNNPTPFIIIGEKFKSAELRDDAKLGDVAPTLWTMMGKTPPPEMAGTSLLDGE